MNALLSSPLSMRVVSLSRPSDKTSGLEAFRETAYLVIVMEVAVFAEGFVLIDAGNIASILVFSSLSGFIDGLTSLVFPLLMPADPASTFFFGSFESLSKTDEVEPFPRLFSLGPFALRFLISLLLSMLLRRFS